MNEAGPEQPAVDDDDEHKGLKAKVTDAIDSVKARIEEYHQHVDNDG